MTPVTTLPAPTLEHVCDLDLVGGAPHVPGEVGFGSRRIVPIEGGTATGPMIDGRVLAIGADWQTVRTTGTADFDARYLIETGDGAVIEVTDRGLRHGPHDVMARLSAGEAVPADEYHMRHAIRLATGDDRYAWVNDTLFVGAGMRSEHGVSISVYAVR